MQRALRPGRSGLALAGTRLGKFAERLAPAAAVGVGGGARALGGTAVRSAGRSRLAGFPAPQARGRGALQELLAENDDGQDALDDLPIATQLQWDSPLAVLPYPHPGLRALNARVGVFDESLRRLAEEMFVVMYEDDGVGLAAPQVGVNVRMMVFNESGDRERKDAERVLVNPTVLTFSKDEKVFEEGCLSFPNIYGDVVRPSKVRVRAQDLAGKKFTMNISGFAARVFQHEYDHLQSTLYCDRMEPAALKEALPALIEMEERFIRENPGVEVRRLKRQ